MFTVSRSLLTRLSEKIVKLDEFKRTVGAKKIMVQANTKNRFKHSYILQNITATL